MADPTPSDRLALALCRSMDASFGELTPPCSTPCADCREWSTGVARELATILRERHGGSSQVADWLDGLAMADPTADTAAAMLKALRSADLSNQPLAVGLADVLEVLIDRESEDFVTGQFISCNAVKAIINHLRANNHA